MKIDTAQIKISGRIPSDLLNNLKEGGTISAKISERIDHKHALLEVNGKKIKAEFIQGVPESEKLSLLLEKKQGGISFFRITGQTSRDMQISELNKYIVISGSEFNKTIQKIRQYSMGGINSIYDLNRSLMDLNTGNTDKILNLFNRLLSKGMPAEDILLLNSLIKSSTQGQLFFSILSAFFPENFKYLQDSKKINMIIKNFIDLINDTLLVDDKEESILDLLNYIKSAENGTDRHGEIIYFDNKFKSCHYIKGESIILSLNMSYLGDLDILIRNEKQNCYIVFYCEKSNAIEALKSGAETLESALKNGLNDKIHILFCTRKEASEKIIEIISAIDINNQLNLKA